MNLKGIIPLLLLLSFTTNIVNADIYLHNPRGSNNRCDSRTNNRRNANRLFDSQNNAAGGYAVGCSRPINNDPNDIECYQMNYYMETVLPIRFTAQHNCGDYNDCQYILQYSCEDILAENVRDGTPQSTNGASCTDIIPEKHDTDLSNPNQYGKHEDYSYYQRCKDMPRNSELFTADQVLRGNSATYTRQNPNGNRYGFECPEERDYYPYWSDSPWIDIAIITNNIDRCPYYLNQSQCNTPKYSCAGLSDLSIYPTDEYTCETHGGHWIQHSAFIENADAPICNISCIETSTSNVNRLGIGKNSSHSQTFHWRLPSHTNDLRNCILRLRYNISSKETPWEFTRNNNSELENNPVFNTSAGVPLRLAINTAQYSRVFEDRSYTFNIINRPTQLRNSVIHNVNVQGKRGNIAQVRNCIEYDFVPNNLSITKGDYIHFQWIGSDYNPHGNDGEGRAGTDRSNLVEVSSLFYNTFDTNTNTHTSYNLLDNYNSYVLASLNQPIENDTLCYTYDELYNENKRNDEESIKNCALLNYAKVYFNLQPVRVNKTGKYFLMSSRNNNFSNRRQMLQINVSLAAKNSENINKNTNKNNNSKFTPSVIIAIIISILVVIGLVIIAIKYKFSFLKAKRYIVRQTSSRV